MKLNNLYRIFVFFLMGFLLSSCSQVKDAKIGDIKNFKVVKLSKNAVTLQMDVPIENPNRFKFSIVDVNLDINVNGAQLGRVVKIEKVKIPARSNETHTIRFDVELSNPLKATAMLFGTFLGKNPKVELKGWVKAKAFMVTKKFDVNKEKTIDLKSKLYPH